MFHARAAWAHEPLLALVEARAHASGHRLTLQRRSVTAWGNAVWWPCVPEEPVSRTKA